MCQFMDDLSPRLDDLEHVGVSVGVDECRDVELQYEAKCTLIMAFHGVLRTVAGGFLVEVCVVRSPTASNYSTTVACMEYELGMHDTIVCVVAIFFLELRSCVRSTVRPLIRGC